jgi:gamma-glutamyltranspeptidase/glutathione hydrolase
VARQHDQEHTEVARGATGRPVVRGTHGIVASGHYLTSMAGMRMLLSGGNAFDAAVAMGFAAAVLEPTASYSLATEGVGMLYHAASGTVQALSGQGVAPQAATVETFRARGLTKIPTGPGNQAHLSFTVPGIVDGYLKLLETYGTKTLGEVLAPAIDHAQHGFPMYEYMHRILHTAHLANPGAVCAVPRGWGRGLLPGWPGASRGQPVCAAATRPDPPPTG